MRLVGCPIKFNAPDLKTEIFKPFEGYLLPNIPLDETKYHVHAKTHSIDD